MKNRTYWLNLFSWKTWNEFLDAGGNTSGFRESRWTTVKKIKPGDYFLCYLTGVSRFIGVLEILSEPFKEDKAIWKDESFPCRFKVRIVSQLELETSIPVHHLRDRLSFFQNLSSPHAWTGRFRGSPSKWNKSDGEAVIRAIADAVENPVKYPVDKKKLKGRPPTVPVDDGQVTIPEDTEDEIKAPAKPTEHTEIQWLLLKLGSDMGLNVWVARNDKNRKWKNRALSSLSNSVEALPVQFNEATNRTIELIDVIWLDKNSFVAAFEVESTTSIYSGLLRLADLISLQPNLNIPLFIVAPDDRRNKVISEVNRPTFSKIKPPMYEMCRYISFSSLKEHIARVATLTRYLKPDILDELSESCDTD